MKVNIYLCTYTSLANPTFMGGAWDASYLSFKRLKAMRNEELFLFDLIYLCCIWAIESYIKVSVIIFAGNVVFPF